MPDGCADTRARRLVPGETAGEFYEVVDNHPLAHCETQGLLSYRQCRAAEHLSRLYGIGGGRTPWTRGRWGDDRPEEEVAAARAEYRELMARVPHQCRSALETLAMGEWPLGRDPLPLLRDGLDVVGDALRLAR